MRHADLFSGIGGFALAARWAGYTTVAFCEIDDFCRGVLARHWPGVPIHGDITTLTDIDVAGWGAIDLLTGGFPCQPFSLAGDQLGAADDRHLWPEMRRIIAAARPCWVCAENVPGIIRMELDTVVADLEALGYTVGTLVVPAGGVGAPHIRSRVFVVAHAEHADGSRWREQQPKSAGQAPGVANTDSRMCQAGDDPAGWQARTDAGRRSARASLAHADRQSLAVGQGIGRDSCAQQSPTQRSGWWDVEPDVDRLADGVPGRVARLRALGNAVVPQQVYPILAAIAAQGVTP